MEHRLNRTFFLCAVFALVLFLCADVRAYEVTGVSISGLSNVGEKSVRDLINIEEGDEFSPKALKDAELNLKSWGLFDKIDVSTEDMAGGIAIKFDLNEAPIVVSIDIVGNYPYLENKIRKNLSLHPGEIFSPERLSEQIERIKAFYAREGYVGTEVYVEQEDMPDWGGVILTFHIRRGAELRVRSIEVSGNRAYPKGKFVSAINPSKQFSERRLSDSIRGLREFYAAHGYPKARIKVLEKKIDFDARRVHIKLGVSEGPHVRLVFKGAPHTSRKTLRKTVTVLKEGSIDSYEIERSVAALNDLFRERSYPDAVITSEKSELPDGTIVIAFNIDEGVPKKIRFLKFRGNEDVGAGELKAKMQNREAAFGRRGAYIPEAVEDDDGAILKAFSKEGYLNARVGQWEIGLTKQGYALEVTIPVDEGPQTIVGEISFGKIQAFDAVKLLRAIRLKPGKPFDLPGVEEDRQRLEAFYADNGYPYAKVQGSFSADPETGRAIVRYDIDEGVPVKIGEILFIGDVLTSQKAILNAMDIREGDPFSYKKIIDSQLNIRRLGPFAAVDIEMLGFEGRESVVHLKVKVEEQRPFMVDMGLAYSTDEGATGSLTFMNVNAFGWAKTNSLKLIAGQQLSKAELGWYDPRFLSLSFEMTTNAWVQYKKRPAYAFTQAGGSLGWLRRLRRFGFAFRYEMDRNYFVQGDSVAANADSLQNNTISRASLSSSYDSRDSFSDPKRGFYTLGAVSMLSEVQGPGANFVKFSWQGENDLGFLSRLVLSTALRFDRIQTIGSNVPVPTNELLFMGGDFTIRGYAEDSLGPRNAADKALGATTRWIVNEELRIRLWRTLDWAFFFDMGALTNTFSQMNWFNIRRGTGFGLRYITPVGPIRLEYAFKAPRHAGESRGRLHFTFGYVF